MTWEAPFPTNALNYSKFPGAEFMNSTPKKAVRGRKIMGRKIVISVELTSEFTCLSAHRVRYWLSITAMAANA
jgi:hypothetical protein